MNASDEDVWPGLAGIFHMARIALESHGYVADEHRDVIFDLEKALGEAILDTIAEVMREHGLKRENEWASSAPESHQEDAR